jgi:hypothetical protein
VSEQLYTQTALTWEVSLWCSSNRRLGVSQKEKAVEKLNREETPSLLPGI